MIVADGLILLFLAQDDLVSLLNRLTAHFPAGETALNAYTTYAMWTFKHSRAMRAIAGGMANPGLNDPRQLEHWVPSMTLLDEIFLTRAPEVAELPLIGRLAFRLAARSTKRRQRQAHRRILLVAVVETREVFRIEPAGQKGVPIVVL